MLLDWILSTWCVFVGVSKGGEDDRDRKMNRTIHMSKVLVVIMIVMDKECFKIGF